MLKELVIAVQSFLEAHRFIKKNKLWKWILIPGIVYMILFCIGLHFFIKSDNTFVNWIVNITHLRSWLDKVENSLLKLLFAFASFILYVILLLFYFSLFKYIVLIIGAPVFAYLSEKTEAILEEREYLFNFNQLKKDIFRGLSIAVRNSLWQTVYTISIIILSFIPVLGWATPVLLIFIECYYYGFSMLDYSSERINMNKAESIYYIGNHKGLATGNGILFYLMHLIPFAGWVLAPAYAVVAATLSMRKITADNNPEIITR